MSRVVRAGRQFLQRMELKKESVRKLPKFPSRFRTSSFLAETRMDLKSRRKFIICDQMRKEKCSALFLQVQKRLAFGNCIFSLKPFPSVKN